MIGRIKFFLPIIFCLLIAGCVSSSKTVMPSDAPPQPSVPVVAEEVIAEVPLVIEKPVKIEEPVRITYNQITNLIGEFLDIQSLQGGSEQPIFLGTSDNKLITLEIVGEKDNVIEASMRLAYPADINAVNTDLNNAMMLRFLRNAASEYTEWPVKIKEIMSRFNSLQIGARQEDAIALERKVIQVLYDKNINAITLTLTHK
ncbi:MAG: hypothetical protein KJ902_04350 [Candidatus Omnitrophica bacterium]|nr:hypothetical protein [Candidatus Omnitrophota bacterium]MBU4457957.1 hypothetical protein [Candidatus Omnitrophota bacterium]